MGTFEYSIAGMPELKQALAKLPQAIAQDVVTKAARKAGSVVAKAIAARAPRDEGQRRRPSKLRLADAVRVGDKKVISRRGKGAEVKATKGAGLAYVGFAKNSNGRIAHILEYGRQAGVSKNGRHYPASPAQPFIRPALEQVSTQAIAVAVSWAEKEIDKIAVQLSGPYKNIKGRTRKLLAR